MHGPKLRWRHLLVEAADPADQVVRDKQTHEGESHQSCIQLSRRGARHQGEQGGPVVKEGYSQSSAIKEWPDRMNRRIARTQNCDHQDQIACSGNPGASANLCEIVRFAPPQCLPAPDPEHQRHTQDAGNRVDRLEPRHRNSETANVERDMLLNPDRIDVEHLIERRRLEDANDHHCDECVNDPPLANRESSAFELPPRHSRRQIAVSIKISGKAKQHEDRGDAEAVMPAINLCQQAADQWSNDRSDIDCRAENYETARSPYFIFRRIKSTDLRRNISLQETRADDEQQQGQEK